MLDPHRAHRAMINVPPHVQPEARELSETAHEHLDDLVTYATHLVYDPGDAVDFVTAGIYHASRYPPARLQVDGRAALYRAVTRACRQELRYPPRPSGPARLFHRRGAASRIPVDASQATRMNTVKRALAMLNFERRAALLMRDLAGLNYREISRALECSPDATARLVAAARREFGSLYREIAV